MVKNPPNITWLFMEMVWTKVIKYPPNKPHKGPWFLHKYHPLEHFASKILNIWRSHYLWIYLFQWTLNNHSLQIGQNDIGFGIALGL
jgi:hypothetical protein